MNSTRYFIFNGPGFTVQEKYVLNVLCSGYFRMMGILVSVMLRIFSHFCIVLLSFRPGLCNIIGMRKCVCLCKYVISQCLVRACSFS